MTSLCSLLRRAAAFAAILASGVSASGQVSTHPALEIAKKTARVKPAFLPLPPGAVAPKGWLRAWAVRASHGITGHLDEYSATFGEAWKAHGFEARGANPDGTGWPLEQCSYWLDGAVRLAWILHDPVLMKKVGERLDRVVSGVLNGGESFIYWRPKPALDNGFNNWAHSHMGRALVAYYQATANPRVLQALVKVYRDYPLPEPGSGFDEVTGAVNIDAMIDTYLMSGDELVLSRVMAWAQRPAYRSVASEWRQGSVRPGHNVIFYENIRVPALLYPWTGDKDDLAASLGAIEWNDRNHMLPLGVSSGEEYHAGIGATRNVETCDVAASMWTYLSMLRITGQAGFADRIERVFFNAGPAPVDRDFKTMCYYQSPNRYSASNPKEEPANPGEHSYRFTNLGHPVLCCVGNLNRIIPTYIMHMWIATMDGGLAAALYGPSSATATVAGGVKVRIDSTTGYPFAESLTLAVNPERKTAFPLYVRVPAWCRSPEISVNGVAIKVQEGREEFVRIARTWRAGDKVKARFPMAVEIVKGRETPYPAIEYFAKSRGLARDRTIDSPWASVCYGPLLFALPIRDLDPNREAPDARYGYALDVASGSAPRDVRIIRHRVPTDWKWTLDSPVQLSVKVREFDWTPTDNQPLPPQPVKGGKPARVLLVPYGCTKFRVSMFPVTREVWDSVRAGKPRRP